MLVNMLVDVAPSWIWGVCTWHVGKKAWEWEDPMSSGVQKTRLRGPTKVHICSKIFSKRFSCISKCLLDYRQHITQALYKNVFNIKHQNNHSCQSYVRFSSLGYQWCQIDFWFFAARNDASSLAIKCLPEVKLMSCGNKAGFCSTQTALHWFDSAKE